MKKINRELKIGSFLISSYFLWAVSWFFFSYFIKGSPLKPYLPIGKIENELIFPGSDFLLGTDIFGRSLLEVISQGLTYSLFLAISVSLLAVCIGIIVGYLSVKGHRVVSSISDLVTNLIFIFPSILIAIMVMSITGQSLLGLLFVLVFTGWPGYARIARGESQRVIALSFVEAAKAIGVGELRLFFKCILPSIAPVLIVNVVLGISGVVISEAALGFLGLGGSEYSWGALLSMGKTVLLEAPYIVVFLSLFLSGLIIGLNLLGDGLRDYIDPKNS